MDFGGYSCMRGFSTTFHGVASRSFTLFVIDPLRARCYNHCDHINIEEGVVNLTSTDASLNLT
jgi:hypothetical protein